MIINECYYFYNNGCFFFRTGDLENEHKKSTKLLEEQFKKKHRSLITRSVFFQTDIELVGQYLVGWYNNTIYV